MIAINFKAVNAISNFNYYEAKVRHQIYINVVSEAENALEIGEGYIFTDDFTYKHKGKGKERTNCQIQLLKFSVAGELATSSKYNKDRIGELHFYKECSDEFMFTPATLCFRLYIDDNLLKKYVKTF